MAAQDIKLADDWSTTVIVSCSLQWEEVVVLCLVGENHNVDAIFKENHIASASKRVMASTSSEQVFLKPEGEDHEVIACLQNQQHKIRFSESVLTGSIIFPLSGVAFLLLNAEVVLGPQREAVFDKIQQFTSIHRNSFLAIVAALHGPEEWDIIFSIQLRFLGSNLKVIPAQNSVETVKSILTIAKATSKPHLESIRDRLLQAKMYIIENNPVWKTLDEI